jgi:hypothetical protein
MMEMKVECNGLNFKIIFLNGKLIIKPRLEIISLIKNELIFSLEEVKLIEFSAKSIIPPIICFFIFLIFLLIFINGFYGKILSSFKNVIIAFLTSILLLDFLLIIIRLNFGFLKIELNNGVSLKVKFVKKREAEEFISKINF